ncbi:MAG: hypothetical protein OEW75_02405 [Cyclobacteriaceae bacterium]|nr:hypothetical protein [Cyclobacteriaceae bacterium]
MIQSTRKKVNATGICNGINLLSYFPSGSEIKNQQMWEGAELDVDLEGKEIGVRWY